MVLILGAGLAGLSAAYHCGDRDSLVLEREQEVGGLCRSFRKDGFTFDCTGHLLHLRDPAVRAWAHELLPGGWQALRRSAWIATGTVFTPYPFQVNTAGLPLDVRLECLLGFIETLRNPERRTSRVPPAQPLIAGLPFLKAVPEAAADEPSFLDWIHTQFGPGFARHFFEPYNRKLWQRDLSEVTGDWVSWSIPQPDLADVLRGALTVSDKVFGYNPDFLYPTAGGIDRLPRAIAARLRAGTLRTGCTVSRLDAGRRRVTLASGETLDGPAVLTSLSLPLLARLTSDLPAALRQAAEELQHVSIRVVNLGVRGAAVHPEMQWVYFADPQAPFHRIGLPTALAPAMSPAGHHSLVAEISYRPEAPPAPEESYAATVRALLKCGLLRDRADIVQTSIMDIPEAYVVFDRARRRVVPALVRWFAERRIVPMGRYGTWDYLAMEDSLVHGQQAAQWLATLDGAPAGGHGRRT
ncbi:MAG: protoporphyrinogen/coproporphyrinogen oxidase [Planctomycetota bacterium]